MDFDFPSNAAGYYSVVNRYTYSLLVINTIIKIASVFLFSSSHCIISFQLLLGTQLGAVSEGYKCTRECSATEQLGS